MKINIVGIDPAIRNFGIAQAILDTETMEYKIVNLILIETEKEAGKGKTIRQNSDDLRRAGLLIEGMKKACAGSSFAFAEIPVGSQSASAMKGYGICVGVLAACPIPLIQVTPSEVKMAACGHKQAAKEEMIAWATNKFPNAPWLFRKLKGQSVPMNDNEHLADAVASIEAGIRTDEFSRARGLMNLAMQQREAA